MRSRLARLSASTQMPDSSRSSSVPLRRDPAGHHRREGWVLDRLQTIANPDLIVSDSNLARWACADERRKGWHCLHEIARYSVGFRAARVLVLKKRMDLRIAELDLVKHLTSLPWFSAMVVLQGQHITYERYAADFGPLSPHSVQSISK